MTDSLPPQGSQSFTALLRASLIVCGVTVVLGGLAWLVASWLGLSSQR